MLFRSARYPLATVRNMTAAASDHGPILLKWRHDGGTRRRRARGRFKYELMWEDHEEFTPMVSEAWQEKGVAQNLPELQSKLASFADHLQGWGKTTFGHVRLELKKLKEKLEELQADPTRSGPSHAEIKITDRVVELNHRKEIMWKQRSRIQ